MVPRKVSTRLPSAICRRETRLSWTLDEAPLQLDAGSRQVSRRMAIPKRLAIRMSRQASDSDVDRHHSCTVTATVKVTLLTTPKQSTDSRGVDVAGLS